HEPRRGGPRERHRRDAAGARAGDRRREGRGSARLVSRDRRRPASGVSARAPSTGAPGGGAGAHRRRVVDHARLPRPALRGRSVREPRHRGQRVSPAVHPVTLEVVRNALYAVAEEMSVILMRSARSPLLKEAGDLSSALTDAEGRLIAQGRDIPIHMGVMAFTVKEFLKRIPAGRLRPGDVWFLNLPEVGGNHLPDVKAIRPVFAGTRLVAFAINLAHWADIGGAVPGSYVPWATESYQEGVRISPVRLFSAAGPDEATFDFSGTAPQARGPVNTTYFIACSSVYYAIKTVAAPEVPPNDGCYRPLHVIVPPRNLLNADVDRPVVGGNHETSQRAVDAIFRALASALPDRVTASGPATSGVLIFGARTPDGRWAIFYETHGGGEGAGVARDGASAIRVYMSNVMNTPSEVVEAEYPLRVEEHALRPGSAGDGRHRGGLGFRRAYRVVAPEATLTSMLDRRVVPPWGVHGGRDGLPYRITLNPGTPGARDIGGKVSVRLTRGDLLLIETCGGGGFGPPADRSAEAREHDRREGYV